MPAPDDLAVAVGAMLNRPFDPDPSPLARYVHLQRRRRGTFGDGAHRAPRARRRPWGCAYAAADAALAPPLHERFPEALRKPRAAVEVLSTIRAERDGLAAPSVLPFHARAAAERVSRYAALVLDPPAAARLVSGARKAGISVTGAIAAPVLQAGAALFGDSEDRTTCLAIPTDLRARVEPPIADDGVVLAIGLLCTPYLVSDETTDTLARDIGEQITREVARGESHLFYRFARAGAFAASDAGIESFSTWVAATPQNIAVSNIGVIDDAGDPPWVRRVTFLLGPAANQVAFVSVTMYRGELVLNVITDRPSCRLPWLRSWSTGSWRAWGARGCARTRAMAARWRPAPPRWRPRCWCRAGRRRARTPCGSSRSRRPTRRPGR